MTTHPSERTLALFYGGEAAPAAHRSVAEHVAKCASCAAVIEDFAYARGLLKNAFPDVAAEDLQLIRESVLASLASQHPARALAWLWAAPLLAAALIIALLAVRPKPVPRYDVPRVIRVPAFVADASRPAAAPVIRVTHHPRHKARAGIQAITLVARGDDPAQIKILTADPRVVIYLQPNGEPQNQ